MTKMTDHADTTPPVGKHGVKISWGQIFKVVAFLTPFLFAAGLAYLSKLYVPRDDFEEAVRPLKPLPARVEVIELKQADSALGAKDTNNSVDVLKQDMAGVKAEIRALREESTRNTDRILNRLDSLNKR